MAVGLLKEKGTYNIKSYIKISVILRREVKDLLSLSEEKQK